MGATVAANDDNADGAVVPPSSTEDEGVYVGPQIGMNPMLNLGTIFVVDVKVVLYL